MLVAASLFDSFAIIIPQYYFVHLSHIHLTNYLHSHIGFLGRTLLLPQFSSCNAVLPVYVVLHVLSTLPHVSPSLLARVSFRTRHCKWRSLWQQLLKRLHDTCPELNFKDVKIKCHMDIVSYYLAMILCPINSVLLIGLNWGVRLVRLVEELVEIPAKPGIRDGFRLGRPFTVRYT